MPHQHQEKHTPATLEAGPRQLNQDVLDQTITKPIFGAFIVFLYVEIIRYSFDCLLRNTRLLWPHFGKSCGLWLYFTFFVALEGLDWWIIRTEAWGRRNAWANVAVACAVVFCFAFCGAAFMGMVMVIWEGEERRQRDKS